LPLFDLENFPGREVRGVWMATVENIDFPISPSDSVATQKRTLLNYVDTLSYAGINAIYFQVRPHGDALYSSSIEPWSQYLTGAQGQAPNPFWDPLEFLISHAHASGIEVHAWINPYRAAMRASLDGLAPNHIAIQFPQYAYIYGTYVWMDPGSEEVQNRTYDVSIDLVTRYDLDGLHMDDYFYPYPVAGVPFPDEGTYNSYVQNGGTMNREDWRRDNVNRLVSRLNVGLHAVKPWIKWSISPFGIYRPGHPEGMPSPIAGFDQYTELFSDPKLWLQEAWVDVLQPQLYWQISAPNQSYQMLLDWWVAQNREGRQIYAGNFLSKVLEGWPVSEFYEQIKISREPQHRARGSWGNIQFSAKILRELGSEYVEYFKEHIYPYPALQPAFPWLTNGQPLPETLTITLTTGSSLSWDNTSDPRMHKVVIYKQIERKWAVKQILPKTQNQIHLENGAYALVAVDRFGRESEKRYINIKT